MSLLYTGRISKLEIGITSGTNTDITNVILMNWERNHDVRPRLYANLKYPTTYQQPHSWILGSFSLLSDNNTALYNTDVNGSTAGVQAALVTTGDSNVIDFFQVTYEDENGASRTTRFYHTIVYRWNKELLNYDDSVWVYHFLAGYAVDASTPSELVSGDADDDSVYLHVGVTSTVSTSFSLVSGASKGMDADANGNLISSGQGLDSIYIHDGVTSTISTSFSAPSIGIQGVVLDVNENLVTSDSNNESVYIHVGITSTISTSFSVDIGVRGIAITDEGNLVVLNDSDNSVFIHDGITSTVSTSFSLAEDDPAGCTITYDGDLVTSDDVAQSIYIYTGVTSTLQTSFSSPSTNPYGLTIV